jgi:hypothetical protein
MLQWGQRVLLPSSMGSCWSGLAGFWGEQQLGPLYIQ